MLYDDEQNVSRKLMEITRNEFSCRKGIKIKLQIQFHTIHYSESRVGLQKKTIFRMFKNRHYTVVTRGIFSSIIFFIIFPFTRYSYGYSVESNLGLPQSEILYTNNIHNFFLFPPMSYPIIIIIFIIIISQKDNFSCRVNESSFVTTQFGVGLIFQDTLY